MADGVATALWVTDADGRIAFVNRHYREAFGLADQPAVRGRLLTVMGDVYRTMGLYKQARPLLERGLATSRTVLSPDDPSLARSEHALGTILRRLGELSEHAGDVSLALECWTTLAGGLPETGASWFEASYHAIRLLKLTDVSRARDAMKLLELSHPNLGPEPWAGKLKELRIELFPGPVKVPPAPGPRDSGGSNGP